MIPACNCNDGQYDGQVIAVTENKNLELADLAARQLVSSLKGLKLERDRWIHV